LAALALTAPPTAPPPELKNRLLRQIEHEAPAVQQPDVRRPGAEAAREGVTVVRFPSRAWKLATAVAASVAFLLAVWNVQLRQQIDRSEGELEAARERLAAADSVEALLKAARGDLAALASPQGSTVTLAGTESRPQARARVFIDPATGRALLFAFDLPILPPEKVYQLWAIKDEKPASAGTFSTDQEGRARLELERAEIVEGADKQRFEARDGLIRARYGHSFDILPASERSEPPEFLYHGTPRRAIPVIMEDGLKSMRRKFVHLSRSVDTARQVGLRRDPQPVILEIRAKEAHDAGVSFYCATEEIYLCESVPPAHLKEV